MLPSILGSVLVPITDNGARCSKPDPTNLVVRPFTTALLVVNGIFSCDLANRWFPLPTEDLGGDRWAVFGFQSRIS